MKIGVIGLGIMGSAMARALIRAGHTVMGYDPVSAACKSLAVAGGKPLDSTAAVAGGAPVLIVSVASSAALHDVAGQISGTGAKARPLVIETSTLPLADKQRARDRLAKAGARVLDCPISGTAVRMEERAWTIFVSGERRDAARARGVLRVFTDRLPYVGPFGAGTKMKFIANHLVAILNVASAEGLALARRMGLAPADVLALFGPSPVIGTGVLRLRGAMMVKRRYRPATMKVEVWQKDMRIIGEAARAARARVPLFDACAPVYSEAMLRGLADADTASVYEVLSSPPGSRRRRASSRSARPARTPRASTRPSRRRARRSA